jgi:hypothetical protein
MERQTLPVFPNVGSRVRIPDPDSAVGGDMLAWTMTPAREVDGRLMIRYVGAGWVNAAKVSKV